MSRNIEAQIICDSINPAGVRLTTFVLTYPRFIHSEFMTHRAFSRNAASSRAIPIEKMIDAIYNNPAHPEQWGKNQKGMQSETILEGEDAKEAQTKWEEQRFAFIDACEELKGLGLHKQICNRLLEPFSRITVVATADQFGLANFFALRAHPMAQPEFQVLAYRMLNAYLKEGPNARGWGQWHLPFIGKEEYEMTGMGHPWEFKTDLLPKISTARCARVSYLTHDGKSDVEKDLELYERLITARPPHASAFEHCAQAIDINEEIDGPIHPTNRSNFHCTWEQYRKTVPNETTMKLNLAERLQNKPEWISL